jgi:hypothetical protein
MAREDGHLLAEVEDNGGAKVQSLAASGSGNGIAGAGKCNLHSFGR